MGNTGSQVGTGLGAAAGAYFGGPAGASVGGALGGAVGGMFDSANTPPVPPQLQAPYTPGAVQGTSGGSYIDPVTGRVVYTSSAGTPSIQSYLDQNTYNQLMGYAPTAGTDLKNQIAQEQGVIDRLKSQGPGSAKLSDYLGSQWIDPQTGQAITPQDALKNATPSNPIYKQFLNETGGDYGKGGFSSWVKDVYNRNVAPALASYKAAQKTLSGNESVYNEQLANEQAKLDRLNSASGAVGATASNPMLDYLNNGPNQSNYITNQLTNQYTNAMNQADQAAAARGMGGSSMQELAHVQGANQLGQAIQGAQVQGAQTNFANRLQMLGLLQGNKAQENSNNNQQLGLYNQQMGQGQGVSGNQANLLTQQNAAQAGMNLNANMAGYNSSLANQVQQNNNWGGAMSALGNYAGQQNSNDMMKQWLANNNQNSSTYGMPNGGLANYSQTPYVDHTVPSSTYDYTKG